MTLRVKGTVVKLQDISKFSFLFLDVGILSYLRESPRLKVTELSSPQHRPRILNGLPVMFHHTHFTMRFTPNKHHVLTQLVDK